MHNFEPTFAHPPLCNQEHKNSKIDICMFLSHLLVNEAHCCSMDRNSPHACTEWLHTRISVVLTPCSSGLDCRYSYDPQEYCFNAEFSTSGHFHRSHLWHQKTNSNFSSWRTLKGTTRWRRSLFSKHTCLQPSQGRWPKVTIWGAGGAFHKWVL